MWLWRVGATHNIVQDLNGKTRGVVCIALLKKGQAWTLPQRQQELAVAASTINMGRGGTHPYHAAVLSIAAGVQEPGISIFSRADS